MDIEQEIAHQITPEMAEEAAEELFTIRDMLRWAMTQFELADVFYGHGTDNAWDEALALILPTLNLPRDANREVLDARLTHEERETVIDAITTRVNEGMPVPYITHEAYFAGMPFFVDERVIIPRSPIAELIANEFDPWLQEAPTNILDMCTGGGCIAIACALQFEEAQVDAVDLSLDALEVAKFNVEAFGLEEQVHLIQSDLFKELPKKQYDLILSNPPYVPAESMDDLPEEYLFEPEMSLLAGQDGLSCAIPILQHAAEYLTENGVLILEVGEAEEALTEALPRLPLTWLEFENGGEGVCAIRAGDLREAMSQGLLKAS